MGRIRIGLSGWEYDSWRENFYPEDLPRQSELSFAAARFDTIEINSTFYGLATPTSFRRWAAAVPPGFVFAVKGSRFITHTKRLIDVDTPLANFFASGVLELDVRFGPILWQLPPNLAFDRERIGRFLDLLPHDTQSAAALARSHDDRVRKAAFGTGPNHRIRHVLEVRHESYLCEDMVGIATRHGIALAFSHSSHWPYFEQITARFVYLRLHGPATLYASPYGEAGLRKWADRIRAWHSGGQPVDAILVAAANPPARKERDVYVYFDNDQGGLAPREAATLRRILATS